MTKIILRGTPPSTGMIYRHRGPITYMTKEGKDCKQAYQWEMKSQNKQRLILTPISVIVELFFKDKKRRDVDNYNKLILDAGSGILWKDDSQIQELIIRKYIDKEKPRVELQIL